jgi:hypothetical protein
MTNVTAGAYADIPLFPFHLLDIEGIRSTYTSEALPEAPLV